MKLRQQSYNLSLADGQRWQFTSSRETGPWLKELTSIMQLEKASGTDHRLKVVFRYSNTGRRTYTNLAYTLPEKKGSKLQLLWPYFAKSPADKITVKPKRTELRYLAMRKALYPVYSKTLALKGLPIHAALIKLDNMGFLLAGTGSSGKSTSCRRLKSPWHSLCDDETLVVCNSNKEYFAHPFPTWSNYYADKDIHKGVWDVQSSVPLKGIFFLQKAKTDKVISISKQQAAVHIYQLARQILMMSRYNIGINKIRSIKRETFNNACELVREVPAFILRIALKGKFWEKIKAVIQDLR